MSSICGTANPGVTIHHPTAVDPRRVDPPAVMAEA
jgi:hypothetical protein